jgi:transcriptional regulator with XRE-family HTH domain
MARYRRERPKKLAGKLRELRLRLEMTQEELAKKLDTDSGSISRFETGKREPSLLEILAYSRLSGVGVEILIDDKLNLRPSEHKRYGTH